MSENSSKRSDSQSTSEPFPGSSLLISLMPLPQLAAPIFPSFPSFSALVGESASEPRTRPSGLFLDLLGDPQILYQDLLEDPKKYEEGVSSLLQEIISGQRKLDELDKQELTLLDRATLDFNQPRRAPPETRPAPAPARVAAKAGPQSPAADRPPKAIGAPDMEPYWWLK